MSSRVKITAPDKETHAKVSRVLSRNGISLMAANNKLFTHIINGLLKPKVRTAIDELGVEVEQLDV